MGLEVETIACDGHVHEGFMIKKILEDREEIMLVIVPAETILLGLGWVLNCSHGEERGRG